METKIPAALQLLIGEWDLEISNMSFEKDKSKKERGKVRFSVMPEGPFVLYHSQIDNPAFPDSGSVIGMDADAVMGDGVVQYTMLYSDTRGVSRIYEMSIDEQEWKLWRVAAFAQRFTARFSNDKRTMHARWESCEDGETWVQDFDITYTKI